MAGKSPVQVSEAQGLALQLLAQSADRCEADRARAILLTLKGWTSGDIAEVFGVREDMVRFWRSDCMRGGIDALRASRAPGAPPVKSEAIERRLHPRMAAVLANSRRVVAELEAEGCRSDQIGLIYNGVALAGLGDAHDRVAVRRSLGIAPDALVAIVVANLIPYKGHADILDALALVRDRLPAGMKLVCIGRDEGARAGLEAKARGLGLDRIVSFLGMRRDVAELLAAADLSILASHEEGFSNAVIEAMAAGLPLVVTDVGGNAEAVADGETGFVVPARSPEALSEAILKLATEPELRRQFGAAGQRMARERFSLSASVDRYETVYRGLLAGRRVGDLDLG